MQPVYKNVGECIETQRKDFKIQTNQYLTTGEMPVIDQGADFIGGYIDDPAKAYTGPLPVIVFGDHTCCLKYVSVRFAVGADGTQLIRPNSDFDVRYFYYALRAQKMEHFGYQRHFKLLKTKDVAWFPLPTQQKIAAILSAYDDLIENNLRRIKTLEEMAQNLYRKWFVKFRFPDHQNARFTDFPLGRIPEGWVVSSLIEACHLTMGQSPKSEFYNTDGIGPPFHQGVTDFGDRYPTERLYCNVEGRIAEEGDILFSVRAPVGRINIANTRMVIGRGLSAIRHKTGLQWFTFHLLKENFKEEDTIGGGTIFKSVTKNDMEKITFILPEESLSQQFEQLVEPSGKQIENLTKKNTTLRRTRDLLLPRLISGEVDVSELDIVIPEEAAA